MATTRERLAKLQKEVVRLKNELAETRRILRDKGLLPSDGKRRAQRDTDPLSDQERAIQALRRAGVLRDLTPEEKKIAAQWDTLSSEEQRRVIEKLKSIKFNPPLSESIIQDRG